MDIKDAQGESRSAYIGGFWGQLVSSVIWLASAAMILLGAYYLPFATLYGMRMFLVLAAILIAEGYVISQFFSGTFSLGAWIGGVTLFVFAWVGRSIATGEASAASTK